MKTSAVSDLNHMVVRYHDGERYVIAVASRGRTRLHLACISDTGVVALDVPIADERYCQDMSAIPVKRAARRMLKSGKQLGITKGARAILNAALSSANTNLGDK